MPEGVTLGRDLIYEILKKVDAPTLAAARSASSYQLRSIADDENLWESLCQKQWPSTTNPHIKSLIISVGGFRKFFNHSFPLLGYGDEPAAVANWKHDASEWVSLIDVVYRGTQIFSKAIHGICTVNDKNWFLNAPFSIDAIESKGKKEKNSVEFALHPTDFRQRGAKFVNNIKVSWIMINRATKQIKNVSGIKAYRCNENWFVPGDITSYFGCNFNKSDIMSSVRMQMILRNENIVQIKDLSFYMRRISAAGHLNGREMLEVLYNRQPCLEKSPVFIIQKMQEGENLNSHGSFAWLGVLTPLFALALLFLFSPLLA